MEGFLRESSSCLNANVIVKSGCERPVLVRAARSHLRKSFAIVELGVDRKRMTGEGWLVAWLVGSLVGSLVRWLVGLLGSQVARLVMI
jgi:hypothetical protein